jgi:ADP-ribose pyrophosphatase
MKPEPWKRIKRHTAIDSKYMKVYFDTIELPSGTIIDDFSVATLPSGVVIVATDEKGRLLTQYEYKYAIDTVVLNLPSGSIENGSNPLETAAIELEEETGYVSDDLELVQTLYEYPSKLDHVLHIVRAKNARKLKDTKHEVTESIGPVRLLSADMDDYGGIFDTTYTVSALALTLPEYLKR